MSDPGRALLGIFLTAVAASGLAVALNASTPTGVLPDAAGSWLFELHQGMAGFGYACLALAIVRLASPREEDSMLVIAAVAPWLGVPLTLAARGHALEVIAACFALSGSILAVLTWRGFRGWARAPLLGLAVAFLVAAWAAFAQRPHIVWPALLDLIGLAALAALWRVGKRRLALLAVLATAALWREAAEFLFAPRFMALIAIVVISWRESRARRPLSRFALRVAAVLFAEANLLSAFLQAVEPEIHIHETLFVSGALHVAILVIVFALIAAWSADRDGRLSWMRWAAVVGAHVFAYGLLRLGSQGNPRRYLHYLPQFQAGHVVVAVGAVLLLAGLWLTLREQTRVAEDRSDVFG